MDSSLSRFEARLQRLIEEGTAKLFSSRDVKGQLASNLVEAMLMEVEFGEGEALVAPGIYTIQASAEHASALQSNQNLLDELKAALQTAAAESAISLACVPVLHISPQEGLKPGEFRVRCSGIGESVGQTQSLPPAPPLTQHPIPAGAFLIVGGVDIFPLTLPIVNIGRKKDNHLVIENPAVSRRHAQLRAISGQYHLFDLGSTGGSKVNNVDVKTAVLLAGDVISLAGVPIIYGQDAAQSPGETQEYRPGENGKDQAS
ncbi:MAG: FhaA domain-containing protein [Anaerolineales bacterium]